MPDEDPIIAGINEIKSSNNDIRSTIDYVCGVLIDGFTANTLADTTNQVMLKLNGIQTTVRDLSNRLSAMESAHVDHRSSVNSQLNTIIDMLRNSPN